jgi:hypothetical protein
MDSSKIFSKLGLCVWFMKRLYEWIVLTGTGVSIAALSFAAIYATCLPWYNDLRVRINTLHAFFDNVVQLDPDGKTVAGQQLVSEYKMIHKETAKFNTQCAVVGFNIPKF